MRSDWVLSIFFTDNILTLLTTYYTLYISNIITWGDCIKKIASFTIDHTVLEPGVYLSRGDKVGNETIKSYESAFSFLGNCPYLS